MSYFDSASLAFLPSSGAGKDGKAYSIKPTDGTGDFTFSRGSNLAATRVGADGLIEKGRENLLTYSNDFNSTWGLANVSVTSGQIGYDGLNDAWLLEKSSNDGRVYQNKSQSGVQTFSVYAKKATSDYIRIFIDGISANVYFNLIDGSLYSANNTAATSYSVDIGNGWWRIVVIVEGSGVRYRIYPAEAGSTSATSGSIYIQDSQLEIGLAATDYIESGATTGKAGLLEDEPRFDYSGGVTCPSLLLEPSRTQLIPQTEYLSGLSLGNSPTLTQNYAVSPEGVQNAVRVQDTDGSNFKTIQTQFSITSGSTYTISIYVKKATSPITTYGGFYFDFDGGTRKTSNLIFDEYNGTLVNASGNAITSVIHPVIDEGDYWRFSATATDTGSNTILRATLRAGASTNGTSLASVIKDYTAYGFQCEQGSYPTSYIPNHSGGTITRGADSCTGAGDVNTFNSTEGVLYAEVSLNLLTPNMYIQISDGTYSNRVAIINNNSSSVWRVFYRVNGVSQIDASETGLNTFETNKIAISWKLNEFKFYVNGVKITQINSGSVNPANTFNTLEFKDIVGNNLFGNMEQVLVFNTALSDADLATLTTI